MDCATSKKNIVPTQNKQIISYLCTHQPLRPTRTRDNKMKSLVSFLLGALLATVFWFFMGYLQVDGDKMGKLLHHDEVVTEELFADAEPAEEVAVQPEPEKAAPTTQPSIVGRWRIADPVGYEERERMLQMDEYGIFKNYHNASTSHSYDYNYSVEGDVFTFGDSFHTYSFQFKLSSVDGQDYLEIYNNTSFGGKWVRSK